MITFIHFRHRQFLFIHFNQGFVLLFESAATAVTLCALEHKFLVWVKVSNEAIITINKHDVIAL